VAGDLAVWLALQAIFRDQAAQRAGPPAANNAALTRVDLAVPAPSPAAVRLFRLTREVSRTPAISAAEGLILGLATKPLATHS
jgi:hypothetical protein